MRLATARYRLLFDRPFTTAHGTRDGTDAVFVRLEQDERIGHGEATLPPYVSETAAEVESICRAFSSLMVNDSGVFDLENYVKQANAITEHSPAARNALTMAGIDLAAQQAGKPVWEFLGLSQPPGRSLAMVTIATADPGEVGIRLAELPRSQVLKVKLGQAHDLELIKLVRLLDARPLLLDANQGLNNVMDALQLIKAAGDRAVALEQPFEKEEFSASEELQAQTTVTVIADESVQGSSDLGRSARAFGGVNVKLMKCGGLPAAVEMIRQIREGGRKVMLGSMSESSLGCLAMYHLSGLADWTDLDGPWLIKNDPFKGMIPPDARDRTPLEPGIGAVLNSNDLKALFAYN